MGDKPVILIVDDEKNTREGLARALRRIRRLSPSTASARWMWREPRGRGARDCACRAWTAWRCCPPWRATPAGLILLTAYGNIETAVEAMKRGAYDFLTKPVNLDRLELLLKRALRERDMEAENHQLRGSSTQVRPRKHHRPLPRDAGGVRHDPAGGPTRATVLIRAKAARARNWWRTPSTS